MRKRALDGDDGCHAVVVRAEIILCQVRCTYMVKYNNNKLSKLYDTRYYIGQFWNLCVTERISFFFLTTLIRMLQIRPTNRIRNWRSKRVNTKSTICVFALTLVVVDIS